MTSAPRSVSVPDVRWLGPADAVDEAVLDRVVPGPVLVLGCGPGRLGAALQRRAVPCLGVDPGAAGVEIARAHGVPALARSVFDPLPGEGRWPAALLLDGVVGAGDDPARLLRRVHALLRVGGTAVVEASADGSDDVLRVVVGSVAFPFRRLGISTLSCHARAAGFIVVEQWIRGARAFVRLSR